MALQVKRDNCVTHPDQAASATCGYCGKAICRQCIAQFGYYCGATCKEQNRATVAAAEAAHYDVRLATFSRGLALFRYAALGVAALVALVVLVWVYRQFFSGQGQVVWSWQAADDKTTVVIVGRDGQRLLVVADDTLLVLALGDGKVLSRKQNDDIAGLQSYRVQGDRLVGVGPARVFCADTQGHTTANVLLQAPAAGLPEVTADASRAYYLSQTAVGEKPQSGQKKLVTRKKQRFIRDADGGGELAADGEETVAVDADDDDWNWEDRVINRVALHPVDLTAGKELAALPLADVAGARLVGLLGNDPLVLARRLTGGAAPAPEPAAKPARKKKKGAQDTPAAEEPAAAPAAPGYAWSLDLLDPASGKLRRRVALPARPAWGPELRDGAWVLVRVAQTLYAIEPVAKRQQQFAVAAEPGAEPAYVVAGGQLFVLYAGGTVAYDLATGAEQWRLPTGIAAENLCSTRDCLYVQGERREERDLNLALPGGSQAPDVLKDFNLGPGTKHEQVIPVLGALDRRTGQWRWRAEGLGGRLLADAARVVLISNTGETGLVSMLKGTNDLRVRQFKPGGGQLYDSVTKDYRLEAPQLFGDRVVGLRLDAKGAAGVAGVKLR